MIRTGEIPEMMHLVGENPTADNEAQEDPVGASTGRSWPQRHCGRLSIGPRDHHCRESAVGCLRSTLSLLQPATRTGPRGP